MFWVSKRRKDNCVRGSWSNLALTDLGSGYWGNRKAWFPEALSGKTEQDMVAGGSHWESEERTVKMTSGVYCWGAWQVLESDLFSYYGKFSMLTTYEDKTGCNVGRDWSEDVGLSTTANGSV